jgi:hypothetical protein
VIVFDNKAQEVIEDVFRKILASKFKQYLHGIKVPLMSSRESFSNLCDFDDEVVTEMIVCGTVKRIEHFGDNNFHIILCSHPE